MMSKADFHEAVASGIADRVVIFDRRGQFEVWSHGEQWNPWHPNRLSERFDSIDAAFQSIREAGWSGTVYLEGCAT